MSNHAPNENLDWWIPELTLDPFGLVSSENQCSNLYNDRYLVRLRLRFSKNASFLSAGDDDDQDTRAQLECSILDKERQESISTARIEALAKPSNWRQYISSTRIVLMHEHAPSQSIENSDPTWKSWPLIIESAWEPANLYCSIEL